MNKYFRLPATTQKSYYGKAVVISTDIKRPKLQSYQTIVCEYDLNTDIFYRLWSGYSKTTLNHVNDFLRLFGHKSISKKEWLSMPCLNPEPVYNVYTSTGFATSKSSALLTANECKEVIQQAEVKSAGMLTGLYE